ncbi:hypothetical protein HCN44_003263 [Aphidius gifuensis]|uniref:FAD-binding FR-type domain-containing protein n=1 Tax=Aphidius gifuensis TaxID=684658 RepID=A0A834XK71_APHGI|nr:NADH-cytochrome b5 reductase-like [Aphidius gifuensis]KAF7987501.1 hypothetical protein HCN44_003263 [Aphidius gifuensis]
MCDDDNDDRPKTPLQDDCCKNDCNPCIFDVHRDILKRWENNKSYKLGQRKNILLQTAYKLFKVSKIFDINDDYVMISLTAKENVNDDEVILLKPGQHIMLSCFSCTRPFTPISWNNKDLNILVRIYNTSLFTNKLKNLSIGDEIKVRGPYGNFEYKKNSYKNIIMFGIGSGIAALYPIAKNIIDDESEESRINLIAGFSSVDQIPMKQELKLLTDYWNFQCTIYLTNWNENPLKTINGIKLISGKINEIIVKKVLENNIPNNTLILICGNKDFNNSMEIFINKFGYDNYHVFK